MKDCCEDKVGEIAVLREKQSQVLKIVLAVNLFMFGLEATYGWIARSTALLGDSLDMLGDATVYAFSLYALNRSERWRNSAALLKGGIMTVFGLAVLGEAISKIVSNQVPVAATMGTIGLLALLANSVCLLVLMRHRVDDLNMRSTWLCSRNDIIANVGVISAAGLVAITGSAVPDIVVGVLIAGLFLRSAYSVVQDSWRALSTVAVALALTIVPVQSRAHGENKPSPHGGFIRMPGAFHTEVKELSPSKLAALTV